MVATSGKHYFEKTSSVYIFLLTLWSTKIKNASYPYKTAISEANVKTNRMACTKLTYHKERNFASNYFIFLKICFNLITSYKELTWCTNDPNVHIHTFCKRWSFILRCFFPVRILKRQPLKWWNSVFDLFVGLVLKGLWL